MTSAVLKCRWCLWTTPNTRLPKALLPDAWDRLADHVEFEHPNEHERLQEQLRKSPPRPSTL